MSSPLPAYDTLVVRLPDPGFRPSHFRREFIFAIKTSIQLALRAGAIDIGIAEECWRSLPTYSTRRN